MPADPIQTSWVEFIVDAIAMHRIQVAVPLSSVISYYKDCKVWDSDTMSYFAVLVIRNHTFTTITQKGHYSDLGLVVSCDIEILAY